MNQFRRPGDIEELKRRAPIAVAILAIGLLLPLDWFPESHSRYSIIVGLYLVLVGSDAVTSSLNLFGLVTTVQAHGIRFSLLARALPIIVGSVAFLCVLAPLLLLSGHSMFAWVATGLLVPLVLCCVGNRLFARRILRDFERSQEL